MNIGRDIIFLKLRKIFPGILDGMCGFWISAGVACFILLILLVVLIFPLSNRYARSYRDIEDLSAAMGRLAVKKDIYNDAWIASAKQESGLYDEELEKCRLFLKERDSRLEVIFSREDPEKGLIKIEDEALWKNEYVKRTSALLAKLGANNIVVNEGALPFENWGSDIPPWDTILPVQKRFWILEAIVKIVLNNSGIIKLKKITFRESSPSYDPSFVQIYTPVPVTVEVELLADRIRFFLRDILKSDIPFVIEGVTILSTEKVPEPGILAENKDVPGKKGANNHVSGPVINVIIDAYIIDYKA